MAKLEVHMSADPQLRDKTFHLSQNDMVFGRDPSCDVKLFWDGASRKHFSIRGLRCDGTGIPTEWRVVDEANSSNNGVFVNSIRVREAILKDGDLVGLGKGRDVAFGSKISSRNLEYLFCLRTKADRAPHQNRLQTDLASKGAHRQLRGAARHPLHGHIVAGELKERKEIRNEGPAGQTYHPCKARVYPQSWWRASASDSAPTPCELQLQYVYGIRSFDTRDIVHYLDSNHIVYPAASLVVIYDIAHHTQQFFDEHDDDVISIAIHPSKKYIASGQVASLRRRTSEGRPCASVLVWNASTLKRNNRPVEEGGWKSRGVLARDLQHRIHSLDFDRSGRNLVVFGGKSDASAMIVVYEWETGRTLWQLTAATNLVTSVKHNPVIPTQFVQCGDRGVRYWDYATAASNPEAASKSASYLKLTRKPCQGNCVAFTDDGQAAIVGMQNGMIIFFGNKGTEIVGLEHIKDAHDGAVLCLLVCDGLLVSSGQDAYIKVWEFQWAGDHLVKPARLIRQVSVRGYSTKVHESVASVTSMDYMEGKLLCATNTHYVLQISLDQMELTDHRAAFHRSVLTVLNFHSGEARNSYNPGGVGEPARQPWALSGVCAFPLEQSEFICTCGDDCTLRIWNTNIRNLHRLENGRIAVADMGIPGVCCDVSSDGRLVAVGHRGGQFTVWDSSTMLCVLEHARSNRYITIIKFSPDCRYLLVGSREASLVMYDVRYNYKKVSENSSAHTSVILSADFSTDVKYLRSADADGNLIYLSVPELKSSRLSAFDLRDQAWFTHDCHFGWDKQGIWNFGQSLPDMNAVTVYPPKMLLATAEAQGTIRLFRYPAISKSAVHRAYSGHSSGIQGVQFTKDGRYLLSTGGYDVCLFQWKVVDPDAVLGQREPVLGMRAD
mmetsp:Transcript_8381/g.28139  ORF Transcript_8381/g.28139 Transcript_8381/m.28139 type:complete len:892 (-) Transcript_8381:144-2819(-)